MAPAGRSDGATTTYCRSSSFGDDDVRVTHERAHHLLRLRLGPELLAVVQVDADARTGVLGAGGRAARGLGGGVAERRPVMPVEGKQAERNLFLAFPPRANLASTR
jgi:hypothetical protein